MLLHETFAATLVDRESLPQGALNIDKRVRTNPFSWTGQFSPQLVEALLEIYAPDSGVVLDPFVGSGTLLAETARIHLAARGYDVNPAAVTLAQVYLGRVSRVLGVAFFNGELVAELAVRGAALEFEKRQERVFRNRYGADIYEDILHFRKIDPVPDEDTSLQTARGIAEQVLSAAGRDASRNGITDAIASLDRVPPSPILDPGAVRH